MPARTGDVEDIVKNHLVRTPHIVKGVNFTVTYSDSLHAHILFRHCDVERDFPIISSKISEVGGNAAIGTPIIKPFANKICRITLRNHQHLQFGTLRYHKRS